MERGIGVAKKEEAAFHMFSTAAHLEFGPAQFKMALISSEGQSTLAWLKRATTCNGNPQSPLTCNSLDRCQSHMPYAALAMGWIYMHGKGIEQNYEQAFHWFNWSMQSKRTMYASHLLGLCHVNGTGAPRNIPTGIACMESAAIAGHLDAQVGVYDRLDAIVSR
jgi:TPR repeat protein